MLTKQINRVCARVLLCCTLARQSCRIRKRVVCPLLVLLCESIFPKVEHCMQVQQQRQQKRIVKKSGNIAGSSHGEKQNNITLAHKHTPIHRTSNAETCREREREEQPNILFVLITARFCSPVCKILITKTKKRKKNDISIVDHSSRTRNNNKHTHSQMLTICKNAVIFWLVHHIFKSRCFCYRSFPFYRVRKTAAVPKSTAHTEATWPTIGCSLFFALHHDTENNLSLFCLLLQFFCRYCSSSWPQTASKWCWKSLVLLLYISI